MDDIAVTIKVEVVENGIDELQEKANQLKKTLEDVVCLINLISRR